MKNWDKDNQELAHKRGQEWRKEVHGILGILGRIRRGKGLDAHLETIFRVGMTKS